MLHLVETCSLLLLALAQQQTRFMLVPDIYIGSANAESVSWTEVGDVALGPNELIYVALPAEHELRVFDLRGEYVRTIGRSGGGPGEFRFPYSVGSIGDRVWVWDSQLNRFSLFAEGGQSVGTVPVFLPGEAGLLADGSVVIRRSSERFLSRIVGNTNEMSPMATISARTDGLRITSRTGAGGFFRQPFADDDLWAISPGGEAVFIVQRSVTEDRPPRFTLTKLGIAGDTVFSNDYPYTPQSLNDEVVNAAVTELINVIVENVRVVKREDLSAASIRRDLELPQFLPPITDVVAGNDGTVWLKREKSFGETDEWLIIQPSGSQGPTVHAPPGLRIVAIDQATVVAVTKDQDGVEFLQLFTMEEASN